MNWTHIVFGIIVMLWLDNIIVRAANGVGQNIIRAANGINETIAKATNEIVKTIKEKK